MNNLFTFRKQIYNDNIHMYTTGQFRNIIPHQPEKVYRVANYNIIDTNNIPIIDIMPYDCLEVAEFLTLNNFKPIILNMADTSFPGGSINIGGFAQEESLFCRSNYFKTLNLEKKFYPINDASGIYSKNVFVFRDKDLNMLKTPFYTSFIAIAAVKEPRLRHSLMDDDDYELSRKKIELMFQIAHSKKYDSTVLSAFGCGAYKNPQEQIINIFNESIKNMENYLNLLFLR